VATTEDRVILAAEVARLERELRDARTTNERLANRVGGLQAGIDEQRRQIAERDRAIERLAREAQDAQTNFRTIENLLAEATRQRDEAERAAAGVARLQTERDQLAANVQRLESELNAAQQREFFLRRLHEP